MITVAGAVIGFFIGWRTASVRGGQVLDRLQYGAGFSIAFALTGFALSALLVYLL